MSIFDGIVPETPSPITTVLDIPKYKTAFSSLRVEDLTRDTNKYDHSNLF